MSVAVWTVVRLELGVAVLQDCVQPSAELQSDDTEVTSSHGSTVIMITHGTMLKLLSSVVSTLILIIHLENCKQYLYFLCKL